MGIQDLGAIGELISSIVIAVTLVVLIYEVRSSKRATIQNNQYERRRARDSLNTALSQNPQLAEILIRANQYVAEGEIRQQTNAREFGIEPNEWVQLANHWIQVLGYHRDQYYTELPVEDQRANADVLTRTFRREPAFAKYYEETLRNGVGEEFRQFADACHPTVS